ncbi:MAG TPA: 16S rRNA (guanine(966)-N(2))-methyltransferase RsmD [Candidatus Hydrogenedentes bacterium]|jgi:16S rRNA (guanine966-N2)-methyltransferase|nr:16S rRNA (guanine(966)-N(2))-methyltransferase RsmD [Candidatus Hydrogenedentota bacterium]
MPKPMRIIAGDFKGRRLFTPRNRDIRPTSDRVRESLFSILGERVRNAQFLDLFCGVGACGIEALSRGAAHATFVDASREALDLARRNLALCGVEISGMLIQAQIPEDLRRPMPPFHLVFADPPYTFPAYEALLEVLVKNRLLLPDARVIIETSRFRSLPDQVSSLCKIDHRVYGDTALSFFS